MICLHEDIALGITDGIAGETSCNTLLKALDLFLAIHECSYPHTRDLSACSLTAVRLTNDHML